MMDDEEQMPSIQKCAVLELGDYGLQVLVAIGLYDDAYRMCLEGWHYCGSIDILQDFYLL